jgi:hypothetical protein
MYNLHPKPAATILLSSLLFVKNVPPITTFAGVLLFLVDPCHHWVFSIWEWKLGPKISHQIVRAPKPDKTVVLGSFVFLLLLLTPFSGKHCAHDHGKVLECFLVSNQCLYQ